MYYVWSKNNYNKDNHSFDSTYTNSQSSSGNENIHFRALDHESAHSNTGRHGNSSIASSEPNNKNISLNADEPAAPKVVCRIPSVSFVDNYKASNSVSTPDARITNDDRVNMRNAYSEGDNIDKESHYNHLPPNEDVEVKFR